MSKFSAIQKARQRSRQRQRGAVETYAAADVVGPEAVFDQPLQPPANDVGHCPDAEPEAYAEDAEGADYPDHAFEFEDDEEEATFVTEVGDNVFIMPVARTEAQPSDLSAPQALDADEDEAPPFDPPDVDDIDPSFQHLETIEAEVAEPGPASPAPSVPAPPVVEAAAPDPVPAPQAELELSAEAVVSDAPPADAGVEPPEESAALPASEPQATPEAPPEMVLSQRADPMPTPPRAPERRFGASPESSAYEVAEPAAPSLRPVPPIRILATWDRPAIAAALSDFAANPLLSRATIQTMRGGVDAAVAASAVGEAPDLVIVDSTLAGAELLNGLDRLKRAAGPETQVIVIGANNDIALLRELGARGVSHYMVAPVPALALVRTICAMFADADKSRVIAVVGARGGVGSSSVAYNIAWSIAERQQIRTALVDLDMPFGAVALTSQCDAARNLADIIAAPDDDAAFERVAVTRTPRLKIVAAPAVLADTPDFGIAPFEWVMRCVRRASPYVVIDLPHLWTPWTRHALERADDVVLVVGPDLASLRNADNILKVLEQGRPHRNPPTVVLSQTGMPKRPEIPQRDFSVALRSAPTLAIPFDPEPFGLAALSGTAVEAVAPGSKPAKLFDQLASALTGRAAPAPEKSKRKKASLSLEETAVEPNVWTHDPLTVAEAEALAAPETPAPAEDAPRPAGSEASQTPSVENAAAPTPDVAVEAPLLYADYLERARKAMEAEAVAAPQQQPRRRTLWFARVGALGAVLLGLAVVGSGGQWLEWGAALAQPRAVSAAPPAPAAAATPADPASEYESALAMLAGGETQAALAHLRAAAAHGHAGAQYRLAQMYERGEGVAVDIGAARQWTERAAARGESRAMHDLGVYYARGEGGRQDDAAAFRWFRQAAEFGVADSQYNLGILYEQGRGVTADASEALFWFMLAAAQGDESARARVAAAETALPPFELEQARVRAQAFGARFGVTVAPAVDEGAVQDEAAPLQQDS